MRASPSSGALAPSPRVAKVLPTNADDYDLLEEVRWRCPAWAAF